MKQPEPIRQPREPFPQLTPIAPQAPSAMEPAGPSNWEGAPNYGGGVMAGTTPVSQPQGYAPVGPTGSIGPGSPASPMASDSPKIYPQMPDGAVVYY